MEILKIIILFMILNLMGVIIAISFAGIGVALGQNFLECLKIFLIAIFSLSYGFFAVSVLYKVFVFLNED